MTLPLLRKPLQVSGETLSGVGAQIRAALLDQHILAEPVVSIALAESRSHPVSVVGAVVHPITFQATSRTTLIDALARAEGLSPTAGGVIIVTSPEHTKTGDKTVEREIKVAELYAGNQPNLNITLTGGEEIRIPEAKKIFVAGDVRRPGMYPMQSDEATTVVKAIALSSGLDAYSSKVAYIYRESSPGAQRTEIAVPLKAIMKHHAPDVAMLPDDILYVPTNDGMRLAGRVLNQMAGFGQTAESGLLIAH
jgi:polysaccharide export outer membrane protein